MVSPADRSVPRFLYGTAWKEERTRPLTELALQRGFRGIDTANQRRHYDESAVGQAIAVAIQTGVVKRDDLFLQTKFTFQRGQDHRLPYDPQAPIASQVAQSFASSPQHLGIDTIDSYLLHGPTLREGLAAADWQAWQAMEALHESGCVRFLGISNVTYDQIRQLHEKARIKPRFVQNRCYAVTGWDRAVRQFCADHSIIYQGFSLLTANREVLVHAEITRLAKRYGKAVSQVIFRFALEVGMIPLTGTTSATHMKSDLEVFDFHVEREDVAKIDELLHRK
jgi:diketogulonate reductase-like aldo/keto reductase